jgi:hypothetical protein
MPAQLPPALHGLPHGVYENSGIAVRIPPERVYEISRNQHQWGTLISVQPVGTSSRMRLGMP